MSEKYYSTLTNDLAKQYRLALAKRLTNYIPEYRSDYGQLKILTSKESNDNLNRMLSLKRPEVFRREQDAALSALSDVTAGVVNEGFVVVVVVRRNALARLAVQNVLDTVVENALLQAPRNP